MLRKEHRLSKTRHLLSNDVKPFPPYFHKLHKNSLLLPHRSDNHDTIRKD
ncbi:MAG: hypothetical protein UHM08_08700 [Bacteroidales bacterium]|nr:hypothetical protein [Bacteroidales bacterium]